MCEVTILLFLFPTTQNFGWGKRAKVRKPTNLEYLISKLCMRHACIMITKFALFFIYQLRKHKTCLGNKKTKPNVEIYFMIKFLNLCDCKNQGDLFTRDLMNPFTHS